MKKRDSYNSILLWENNLQREKIVISWIQLLKQNLQKIFVYILLKIGRK